MCGLKVSVDADEVTDVRGNPDDVWSQGHLCPKGTSLAHLHTDPDRLRRPMIRTRNGHTPVSWDDAYAEVERVLRPVLDRYGAPAVTVYVGNPVAHNLGLSTHIGALIGMAQAAGMPAYYSPGTVDQWPLNLVSALLFGHMWNAPIPDVDRTDHLMILGANPSASQGSMLSAPDLMGRLAAIRRRGGAVTVVDPRRTLTAQRASQWVPIRPGTDALLLFAILHTLAEQGWVRRPAHLDGRVTGLDDVIAMAADFSPESVADACGIDAPTIRQLAHDLAHAETPVLYSRIGACTQEFGTLATWLVFVINIALGSLDRPGGAVFPKPAMWSPMFMKPPDQDRTGWQFGRFRSRVRGAPEVFNQFPISCLAEEIDTPGDGQLHGLITVAGNPVVSAPGTRRLDAALASLDAMISVDSWLNETSRHAHVILPGLSPLERSHSDDLYWIYAISSCVKWSDPVFAPDPERPAGVGDPAAARRCDGRHPDARRRRRRAWTTSTSPASSPPHAWRRHTPLTGRDPAEATAAVKGIGPERLVDLGIRLGPWGDDLGARPGGLTLDEVRRHPERAAAGRAGRRPPRRRGLHTLGHSRTGSSTPSRRRAEVARTSPATGRGNGAHQPAASALQQLVDAQRARADAGQGPLHSAHSSGRRPPGRCAVR